jgi:son of sevenless-like protein
MKRCLTLRNFNTMIALVSGLNGPAIRRLKRTWEQVGQRTLSQLEVCEWTMDSGKNFNNYRTTLAKVTPPCVPFFGMYWPWLNPALRADETRVGVYLTQLTFIQDGNPDNADNNLINFSKRHKAAEVISDIKRWQTKPYNLQPITGVVGFIEESLSGYSENPNSYYNDEFWRRSLELEPREREDEKMARLLQESGFL